MVYLIGLLILLFVFVGIVPFVQTLAQRYHMDEEVHYKFPQELFNSDMDHLRFEQTEGQSVFRLSLQDRGSVRLAKGHILSVKILENRKAEAYSVLLP